MTRTTGVIKNFILRFESADFTCEWKYDGERAQIHVLERGGVEIYSRNSENNTSKYPDIISRMPRVRGRHTPLICASWRNKIYPPTDWVGPTD